MAAHYRNVIANMLQEFDENAHSRQFCKDLSFKGLLYCNDPTWIALPQTRKDRIKNIICNHIFQNKNETCP